MINKLDQHRFLIESVRFLTTFCSLCANLPIPLLIPNWPLDRQGETLLKPPSVVQIGYLTPTTALGIAAACGRGHRQDPEDVPFGTGLNNSLDSRKGDRDSPQNVQDLGRPVLSWNFDGEMSSNFVQTGEPV
jgi:hypothetical protein